MINRKSETKKKMLNNRLLTIICTLVFVIAVIPLWWRSTGAFQTKLPHADIQRTFPEADKDLLSPFTLPVYMTLHYVGSEKWIQQYATQQNVHFEKQIEIDRTIPLVITNKKKLVLTDSDVRKLNNKNEPMGAIGQLVFSGDQNAFGQFTLILLEENLISSVKNNHLYLGPGRYASIALSSKDLQSTQTLVQHIQNVYNLIIFKEASSNNEDLQIKSSSNSYQLSFSLINQDPNSRNINWNFKRMEDKYLRPFLNRISPLLLSNVSVDSQVMYYGRLPSKPSFNSHENRFQLAASEMQLLLNENDWKFDSYAHNDPTVHFLLLALDSKSSPLHVLPYSTNSKAKRITSGESTYTGLSDAYVIPRWGGVVVLNPLHSIHNETHEKEMSNSSRFLSEEEEIYVMQAFIEQMRMLLALPSYIPEMQLPSNQIVHFVADKTSGISSWELDGLIRIRILQNLHTARHSLLSLSKVVNKMSNVLVMQEVAILTKKSLYHSQQAFHLIRQAREQGTLLNYTDLLSHAKSAVEFSEKAFFHSSMISILHFPDTQKLAVYLPLVLPVIVTLCTSAFREISYQKKKKKESSEAQAAK